MQNKIEDLVKLVEKNGKVMAHQDISFRKVSEYRCSTFIKNKNVLVKGESNNKHTEMRNAMIVLLDSDTCDIIGESRI